MALLTPNPPRTRPDLSDARAMPAGLPDKPRLKDEFQALRCRMEELQGALGAEGTRALLVVLQGRDTSGKDGVIKRVFSECNPARMWIRTFKRPTVTELAHDYLWRIHRSLPPRGHIGVFNRSHYEDVLPVRVHQLVPEAVWRRRYDQINGFEQQLVEEGTVVLKFFLHISRDEQLARLNDRLDDPTKNWKFEAGDLRERAQWDAYTEAYAEALELCSTPWAPWYIVPADKNRPRDYLIAQVIVEALETMNPRYPEADPEVLKLRGTLS